MDLKIDDHETDASPAPPPPPPSVWRPAGVIDWLAVGAGVAGLIAGAGMLAAGRTDVGVALLVAGAAVLLLRVAVKSGLRWLRAKLEAAGAAVVYIGGKIT